MAKRKSNANTGGRAAELFTFLQTCPKLADMMAIAGYDDAVNTEIIIPMGSSSARDIRDYIDACGNYNYEITPTPSIYEDFQINCFRAYEPNDTSVPSANCNVLSYEDVQAISDWIFTQDEAGNLPNITGKQVVSIEPTAVTPWLQYVNQDNGVIAYSITVRLRYVNTRKVRGGIIASQA